MEAIFSSKMSVDFQRTTRRYVPEDNTFQRNLCPYSINYMILNHDL
jgi:hypothetical protein